MVGYSYIDPKAPSGIPPARVNGGLYTGELFVPNAPWANVPVAPDIVLQMSQNLASADPPPNAVFHVPGYLRLGNNTQPAFGRSRPDPARFPTLFCTGR
jgi:hypothetical protein